MRETTDGVGGLWGKKSEGIQPLGQVEFVAC